MPTLADNRGMTTTRRRALLHRWSWPAILTSAFLAACGGGGGGSSDGTPAGNSGTFAAVVSGGPPTATGIQGTSQPLNLTAALSYTGTGNLYLAAEADSAVALSVNGQLAGDSLMLTVTLRGDLAPGTYPSEVLLLACLDQQCVTQAPGSPVHVPISYVVKPGIAVQQQVNLSRTGADPAPSATLPVTSPAEAGTVTLLVSNAGSNAIAVAFDGTALSIQTTQVPAGTYTATATLQSSTDIRYSRAVSIAYTVAPPPGGEHPLAVDNASRSVVLQQGTSTTQHITLTRPTWTDVLDAPQISGDDNHLLTLVDLGNDQYDVTISGIGVPLGDYSPGIVFSAGPTGGVVVVRFSVGVSGVVYLGGDLDHVLTAASTIADLGWSNPVLTFDGVQANWSAVSMSPFLHVVQASGRTGVDALRVTFDGAALAGNDTGFPPVVQLTVDRPGTSPVPVQFNVLNQIPTLQRVSPRTLVGNGGRIYIEGAFSQYGSGLTDGTHLHVSGATVTAAQILADSRFVGDVLVLAVDVTGASPGTPVTLSVDSALLPTGLSLPVVAARSGELPDAAVRQLPAGAIRSGSRRALLLGARHGLSMGLRRQRVVAVAGKHRRPDRCRSRARRFGALRVGRRGHHRTRPDHADAAIDRFPAVDPDHDGRFRCHRRGGCARSRLQCRRPGARQHFGPEFHGQPRLGLDLFDADRQARARADQRSCPLRSGHPDGP